MTPVRRAPLQLEAMRNDILLITPEYNGSVPGTLKSAID
jgi:NAD(P)H-dependent FMN reductase